MSRSTCQFYRNRVEKGMKWGDSAGTGKTKKKNASPHKYMGCLAFFGISVVGDTGFEPVTSTV